jgi:hypothetical protein
VENICLGKVSRRVPDIVKEQISQAIAAGIQGNTVLTGITIPPDFRDAFVVPVLEHNQLHLSKELRTNLTLVCEQTEDDKSFARQGAGFSHGVR